MIETIGELAEHEIELDRRPVQRGDVRRTGADTSLARASLGWEPQVTLREGLAATVEWASSAEPACGRRSGRVTRHMTRSAGSVSACATSPVRGLSTVSRKALT